MTVAASHKVGATHTSLPAHHRAVLLRGGVVLVTASTGVGVGIGMADVGIAVVRILLLGLVVMLALLATESHRQDHRH